MVKLLFRNDRLKQEVIQKGVTFNMITNLHITILFSMVILQYSNRKQIVTIHEVLAFQKKGTRIPTFVFFFRAFPKTRKQNLKNGNKQEHTKL